MEFNITELIHKANTYIYPYLFTYVLFIGRSASFSIVSPSLRLFPSTSSFYGLPLDITAQLQPPLDENDGKVVFQCGSRLWNVTERKGICYRETSKRPNEYRYNYSDTVCYRYFTEFNYI